MEEYINIDHIGDDLKSAYEEGYEQGKKDAEFYLTHCGDESPITNGDNIRSMTDEELCDEYFRIYHNVLPRYTHARLGLLDWLKEEVER